MAATSKIQVGENHKTWGGQCDWTKTLRTWCGLIAVRKRKERGCGLTRRHGRKNWGASTATYGLFIVGTEARDQDARGRGNGTAGKNL